MPLFWSLLSLGTKNHPKLLKTATILIKKSPSYPNKFVGIYSGKNFQLWDIMRSKYLSLPIC